MKAFLFLLFAASAAAASAEIIAGPVVNPANGHTYYLLSRSTWADAQAQAVALGGNLATIRNAREQEWIYSTFKDYGVLWIGLTDQEKEGEFKWISGEPVDYTNWPGDQPDNGTGGVEHYVHIWPPDHDNAGKWNDYVHTDNLWGKPLCGVVEVSSIVRPPAPVASFSYPDFHSTAGLVLRGHAAPVDNHLRLTPSIGGKGLGGAWRYLKQTVTDGFETTFQIQITEKIRFGADGLAFVIHDSPGLPDLGWPGCNMGFGGLTNLIVIKFDTYHWRNNGPVSFDEIALLASDSMGAVLWDNQDDPDRCYASVTNGIVFSDGAVHTVRISYVPGNLRVFLDDLENPVMTVFLSLPKLIHLDDGRAWIGFTAASGADWQTQEILSWSFTSLERSLPDMPIARRSAPPEPAPSRMDASVFVPQTLSLNQPSELPHDPVFGYRIPAGVGLSYGIEVSSDLVHWTEASNVELFFRDPDSTNQPARFYRFRLR